MKDENLDSTGGPMPKPTCPLKPADTPCDDNCAWLLPEDEEKRCAIAWLPRLAETLKEQTAMVKGLLAMGVPGFPPDPH